MILLVTGHFTTYNRNGYENPKKEFITSHGVDLDTDRIVITPNEHPKYLGGVWDDDLSEWVIP